MKRVAITTLGCKTNQFESAALARRLEAAGYTLVPFPGPADAIVINTCTVTQGADADSRQLIRRAAAASPEAVLVVTGCYAQVAPGEVAGLPGVDYVVGHADKGRIAEILAAGKPTRPAVIRSPLSRVWDDRALAAGPTEPPADRGEAPAAGGGEAPPLAPARPAESQPESAGERRPPLPEQPVTLQAPSGPGSEAPGGLKAPAAPAPVERAPGQPGSASLQRPPARKAVAGGEEAPLVAERRTRAFLKVQDGCDVFCTFCIVPFARGRSRSLPVEAARARLRALATEGYREAVLTGIHLGDYGRDLDPPADLLTLLRALAADAAVPRLRISSLFPTQLTAEFIDLFASSPVIVPHLHLSIQSGDDGVLARMRRRYGRAEIEAAVRAVAARVPDLGLGADLIVGFPGESEAAFEQTLAMVEALPFTYLHVFPYSPRPGTAAARFDGRVPPAEIKRRSRLLRAAAVRKRAAWHGRFVGRTVEVLVERPGEGRSREYLRVRLVQPDPRLVGRLVPVEVVADEGESVLGRVAGRPAA